MAAADHLVCVTLMPHPYPSALRLIHLSNPDRLVSQCCGWWLVWSPSLGRMTPLDWSLLFVSRLAPYHFSLQCVHKIIGLASSSRQSSNVLYRHAAQLMPFHYYRGTFIPLVQARWHNSEGPFMVCRMPGKDVPGDRIPSTLKCLPPGTLDGRLNGQIDGWRNGCYVTSPC